MNKTVYIETLGCSKNQVDSEVMMGLLHDAKYQLVSDPLYAEIIIVNTCGFIESAKEESIDTLLSLAEYKKTGQCKFLIAAGCLAQRYAKELEVELSEIDAFVGTTAFEDIIKIIPLLQESNDIISRTEEIDRIFDETLPRKITDSTHFAYLKISEGCDNRCTYCIIPKLRGKYRSRPMDAIISEAKALAKQGVKELILIAQDTTRYGIDLYGKYRLAELLSELNKIEAINDSFYTVSRGITETTLIVNSKLNEILEANFKKSKLLSQTNNLSAITIKLPEENVTTEGIYYFILKALAWQNISLEEVISTTNEFTIVVESKLISQAFKVLSELNQNL